MLSALSSVSWSEAISAAAAAVNAILVGVLVRVTWKYAKSTQKILEESRLARVAAQQQAAAATSQASAAQSQAIATYESLALLKQQLDEQIGLGRSIVQTAIASVMSAITYWRQRDLKNFAGAQSLPPTESLVPTNAQSAVEHARRISPSAAEELSGAFDDLRNAKNEIERMRSLNLVTQGHAFQEMRTSQAEAFLVSAFAKIQTVQSRLL